jgi:homoserine O-acetyltransferase
MNTVVAQQANCPTEHTALTGPSKRLITDQVLTHGGVMHGARIAYSDIGPETAPSVLVMGGISADRQVSGSQGWWSTLVGPGRVIDTRNHRVIGFDWLGGWGDSTRTEGPDSPLIDTLDQANSAIALLNHLGIERLDTVIGSSYGGLVAQQLGRHFPDRVGNALIIGAGHRPFPMATALRCIQRRILRQGARQGQLQEATALARSLALTTYRSNREFSERFDAAGRVQTGRVQFDVDDYLHHGGRKFADRFGAWAYLRLSESIDLHQVEPERISVPLDLVAFEGDQIAPPEQLREFKRRKGRDCRLWVVASRYGHDGFLKEEVRLRPIISRVLGEATSC